MTRRKPGPKPRPVALLKRHGILIKLTDGELATIRRMARSAGLPVAAYVRQSALAA